MVTKRKPNFENLLKVLRRETPSRPVLMELFMNGVIYNRFCDPEYQYGNGFDGLVTTASSFANLGYDYFTASIAGFGFPQKARDSKQTTTLNHEPAIYDRKSFDEYQWPDAQPHNFEQLTKAAPYIPEGMKAVMIGPSGVLENTIAIMGYDNLCEKLYEDPQLVSDVTENVGRCLVKFYTLGAENDLVGAAFGNDDWGFNTQTMLSPKHMREYIFPWHKKIVEAMHSRNKPCILHSCGNPLEIMDDIAGDIKYDGRHSYEDNIIPVEDFYERFHDKIAVIGGIDVNFITTAKPEEIKERSKKMLERTSSRGGYALGTGNSVPEYIPVENYLAMLSAAYDLD
ncbi:MAG: uroporphyrinogen decarboxylase family protein [Oscillospiraceae bacterium]|nr:uroporphyrinogen decarboxylase family protein [Oscillospiraceae bacterium]